LAVERPIKGRLRWALTVRAGPKVERSRHASLDAALDALERRVDEIAPDAHREEVSFFSRKIEPGAQVAARLEIAGPGGWRATVHGGLDLRGDGSAEAYTGRIRRALVEQRDGESAAAALRRALGGAGAAT
jgi:hypothetical protein